MGINCGRIALALWALLLILALLPGSAEAGEVEDFQGTWVDRALDLQYELSSDVPLLNAPYVGTHNSFNSVAEMGPTLSAQDSNQVLDLTDQLEIDIRSLELDLHRFPSADGPGYRPVVCHALGGGIGCTAEKTLDPVAAEIGAWLRSPENRDQVLFLYLEDDLQDAATHDDAAAILEQHLGDLIFRPPAGGCSEVDYGLSRDDVRAAGKQVVIVSGCGAGSAWPALAFSWDEHAEERPFDYEDVPTCGPTFSPADYRSTFIRYYEDSTELTRNAGTPDDGITPATAAAMARCGVDLIGFDQLEPFDGRLRKSVWSWEPGEPDGSRCALMRVGKNRPFGRWIDRGCRRLKRPVACNDGERWKVLTKKVGGWRAKRRCEDKGLAFAVPRSGAENQKLRRKMERRGALTAWLGQRRQSDGSWEPLDPR